MPYPAHYELLAGGSAAPAFDPIGDVGWAHAYWADGPEMLALGYANAASVSNWPDEVGTADLTNASGSKPLYLVGTTNSVSFNGSSNYLGPATYSTINATHSVVLLVNNSNLSGEHYITDGVDSTHRRIIAVTSTGKWRHYAGADTNGGSVTSGLHGIRSKIVSGTSDVLNVDGSNVTTATAGDQAMTGLTLGQAYDHAGGGPWWNGLIVFVGVYNGDVTSDGGWAGFVSWASSYYAITVG